MFKISQVHLLFLLLFFHFVSKAQDRTNYALLWEIKPPNSEKKSYLFGTAHLRDPRVFDFSDAMIPAISQSEAFALEVHPDSVTGAISEYFVRHENTRYYRDVLSDDEYEQLDSRVVTETGESLDSIDYNSLYFLESLLRPELDKEGDKETFLDAYLYGVANTMDKDIYGLEKLEDQMPDLDSIPRDELRSSLLELIDLDEEEYREGVASLVDVYTTGNIDRILLMSQGLFSIDKVMIRRNKVMIKSMKRIMESQSLFTAVGAAHLPGDYGLINLLREEGYIVSKVESVFTGSSNNFIVKPNIKKWSIFKDPMMGYQLKVPGISQKMPVQDGFEMNIVQDLFSGSSFFYFPMDLRSRGVEDLKVTTEALIARFTSTTDSNNTTSSEVERKGKTFFQVKKKNEITGNLMRIEVFAAKGVLYVFGSEYVETPTSIATIDAFFDSITITEAMAVEVPSIEWKPFDSSEGGFTVDLPGIVKDMSRQSPNPQDPDGAPYELNLFMGQDLKNEYNYLIRYNNFPLGYYLENESAVADEFAKALINQGQGTKLVSRKKITYQGMSGYDLEIKIQDKYNSKVRYLSRGNKTYLLLAQKINETDSASFDNPVFNSFEIKDFLPAEYETITAEDNSYSFLFPKEISKEVTTINEYNSENEQSIDYFGLEENSGDVFVLSEIRLKPYFKIQSKEMFYDEYISLIKSDSDSIYKQESFLYQGLEAKDFYLKNEHTRIVQKYRFVMVGNKFISLSTYQAPEHTNSIRSMAVMNGMKFIKPGAFDVFSSKSKSIFKALRSKDRLKYNEAAGALDYYDFDREDEKLLQKNLYLDLPNDSLYWGVKNLIVYNLGILGLNNSLPALKEYYLSDKSSTKNKLMTLQALTVINTSKAIKLYVDLLKNHPTKNTEDNEAVDPLGYAVDSLLTIQKYGSDVLSIQKNDALRDHTISYFNRQITKDSIYALPFMRKHTDEFLDYFYKDVAHYLDTTATESSKVNMFTLGTYIDIIDTLSVKKPKILAATKRLFVDQKELNYISLRGFLYYINTAEAIDKMAVQAFLEPQYYRFEGIQALLEAGKTALIPTQYLEKKAIAEISIYNAVGYDDTYPNSVIYKDTYVQDGKRYMAFIYTFDTEEGQDNKYLGLVLDQEFSRENPIQFSVFYQYEIHAEGDWKVSAKNIIDSYTE